MRTRPDRRVLLVLALALSLCPAAVLAQQPEEEAGAKLFANVDPAVVAVQHERAGGSGFIISSDGYIITNGHVAQGDIEADESPKAVARRITVILSNEKRYKARVIGHSLDPDVALLKIEPEEPLQTVTIGNSDTVKPGQRSYAYGMPTGLKRTLTAGIVSNVERTDLRTFTKVIQTDAAINPGNSGGPLFSEKGEVLGINTYGRGGEGLGFTIPINVAMVLKDHFMSHGYFRRAALPFVVTRYIDDELAAAIGVGDGVLVDHVETGSLAATAGLAAGDIITEMNGRPVAAKTEAAHRDFIWALVTQPVGGQVKFKVLRKNGEQFSTVEIEGTLVEDEPAVEHGWQIGEIDELRYDDIGLGVKPVTALSRYLYGLPNVPCVRVTTVRSGSLTAKAEIREGDLFVALDEVNIGGVEEFRKELEKRLVACQQYIRVTIMRGNDVVRTAIKPYYDLKGKRVALVVPPRDAEHLETILRFFTANGCRVSMVSSEPKVVIGSEKGRSEEVAADVLIDAFDANAFDGVLIVGGKGAESLWQHAALLQAVKNSVAAKKALGAVGTAAVVLANAEPALADKKMTTAEEYSRHLLDKGMKFTGKDVERDGNIVTTSGFDKRIIKAFLAQYRAAVLHAKE